MHRVQLVALWGCLGFLSALAPAAVTCASAANPEGIPGQATGAGHVSGCLNTTPRFEAPNGLGDLYERWATDAFASEHSYAYIPKSAPKYGKGAEPQEVTPVSPLIVGLTALPPVNRILASVPHCSSLSGVSADSASPCAAILPRLLDAFQTDLIPVWQSYYLNDRRRSPGKAVYSYHWLHEHS